MGYLWSKPEQAVAKRPDGIGSHLTAEEYQGKIDQSTASLPERVMQRGSGAVPSLVYLGLFYVARNMEALNKSQFELLSPDLQELVFQIIDQQFIMKGCLTSRQFVATIPFFEHLTKFELKDASWISDEALSLGLKSFGPRLESFTVNLCPDAAEMTARALRKCVNITYLDIAHCYNLFPLILFAKLPRVETLSLCHCRVTELNLTSLVALKHLNIAHNTRLTLSTLKRAFSPDTSLESMDVTDVDELSASLPSLRAFAVAFSGLKSLRMGRRLTHVNSYAAEEFNWEIGWPSIEFENLEEWNTLDFNVALQFCARTDLLDQSALDDDNEYPTDSAPPLYTVRSGIGLAEYRKRALLAKSRIVNTLRVMKYRPVYQQFIPHFPNVHTLHLDTLSDLSYLGQEPRESVTEFGLHHFGVMNRGQWAALDRLFPNLTRLYCKDVRGYRLGTGPDDIHSLRNLTHIETRASRFPPGTLWELASLCPNLVSLIVMSVEDCQTLNIREFQRRYPSFLSKHVQEVIVGDAVLVTDGERTQVGETPVVIEALLEYKTSW